MCQNPIPPKEATADRTADWRLTNWLAQLVGYQSAVWEVSGSIPGRTNTHSDRVLK